MSSSLVPTGSFRCAGCGLVQFTTELGACRRCGAASSGGGSIAPTARSIRPEPEELPTLTLEDAHESASEFAPAPAFGAPELELDFPPPPRRRPSLAPETQPALARLSVRPAPAAKKPSDFVDPASGMVRTWIVATLFAICVCAILAGRVVRMVHEAQHPEPETSAMRARLHATHASIRIDDERLVEPERRSATAESRRHVARVRDRTSTATPKKTRQNV